MTSSTAPSIDQHLNLHLAQPWPTTDTDNPALAALLWAITTAAKSRISDLLPTTIRTTAEHGAVSYWLTHDDTPFAGDFPRHDEEVAVTIDSLYLPDLRLVPTQCSGFQLIPVPAPPSTHSKLRSCRHGRSLRLALSSLGAAAQFQGAALPGFPDDEPTRFRLTGLQNDIAEQTHLLAMLEQASAGAANILVLPELRVTPAMEGAIQQFLAAGRHSLAIVVAGSWHHPAPPDAWENRSAILGARGEILWHHRKLREYNATPGNVAAAPAFFAGIGIGPNGGREGILRGCELQFCDTPIGRLCVAICVGFFHSDVRPALAATRADYFLVPAMTARIDDLHRAADELARQWAVTAVANCGVVGAAHAASFSRKPLKNEVVQSTIGTMGFIDFTLS